MLQSIDLASPLCVWGGGGGLTAAAWYNEISLEARLSQKLRDAPYCFKNCCYNVLNTVIFPNVFSVLVLYCRK